MVRGLSAFQARAVTKVESIPGALVTIAVFAVAFPILAYNAAPGISFHDSGEFALAVQSAGIPHSPGAPTWMILNLIFKLFTFGSEAARSANLFSAFCGSVTAAFSSAFVFRHFSDRSNAVRWLSSIVTALCILCTGAFLEQSFIAEQYTLMTAFMSAILLVVQTNDANPKASWYYLLGVLWGLAIGNHPSQIILGFVMLLPVLQKRKDVSMLKSILLGIVGLLTGLLVFIYLPVRASANPVMNWGHPSDLKQFLWNIKREQWPTRALSAAPVGFIKEWFRSYNVFGEMGIIGGVLAIFGFVFSFRRAPKPLSWLFMLAVPYAVIMLLGHLRQEGMDLIYVRFYGVRDWHIPLYMSLAIIGSMGAVWLLDMRHKCTEKVRVGTLSTVALGLAGFFPFQLQHESMRNFGDAKNFTNAYLEALPQNAILATYCDNSSHPAAYEHFAHDIRPDLYFTFGMPQTFLNMEPNINWNSGMKKRFLTEYIETPALNPISLLSKLTPEEIQNRPLYTEFISGSNAHSAENCLPYGYLVQLVEHKTSNAEVIAADQEFQTKHPELFQKPIGTPHRLSREAFSYAHLRRGLFFIQRKLYPQAKQCLELALTWEPKNPQILFPYGATLEELKDYEGAEKAYLDCIQAMPDFANPRQNLALLYSYGKDYPRALELAKEELILTKGAKNTQQLIAVLEQKLASGK